MNVLFLTIVLPGRLMGGGELWSQAIIDGLRRQGATVTVMGYQRFAGDPADGEVPVGRRTVETSRAPLSALRWGAGSVLAGRPYTVQKWIGAEYRSCLRQALRRERWDLVVINHAGSAWALDVIGEIPFVHVSHQAEALLYRDHAMAARGASRAIYSREARLLGGIEARLAQQATAIWCINDRDEKYFTNLGARNAVRLPPMPRADWPPADGNHTEAESDLVLLGSWTWKPNREALHWFLREVMPLLPPDWSIRVGGKFSRKAFAAYPNALFSGVVPDPCAFLRNAKRIAVPSAAAHGAPLKLLDAIAALRPVVADSRAIQAIGPVPAHVVGATSASDFAEALRRAHPVDPDETASWLSGRRACFDSAMARTLSNLDSPPLARAPRHVRSQERGVPGLGRVSISDDSSM